MPPADFNPYVSPQWPDSSPLGLPPPLPPLSYDEALFRRRVRMAVACLAPLILANWWLILQRVPDPFRLLHFLNLCWLVPALVAALFLGDRILMWVGSLLHGIVGGKTPLPVWLAVGRAALWMLPWAAAAGAVVWATFLLAITTRRGLPQAYFICPAAGHLLAAFCYVPLVYRWWHTRRHFATPPE